METLTGKDLANALQRPFDPQEDLEWKAQSCGKNNRGFWALVVPYIKVRAIRDRLDEVVGPENWKTEKFEPGAAGGLQCGLSLRINGEWITKWDGAENMGDREGTAIKGGMSDAFKRVARAWGIGRYLTRVEVGFGTVAENGIIKCQTKSKERFKCNPPGLPAFCFPENYGAPEHTPADREPTFQEIAAKIKEVTGQPTQESAEERQIAQFVQNIDEGIKEVKRRQIKIEIDGKVKSAFTHLNRRRWEAKTDWQQLHELEYEIASILEEWEREQNERQKAA